MPDIVYKTYEEKDMIWVIAEIAGKEIGFLKLWQTGTQFAINTVGVLEEYRNQRIATGMLDYFIDHYAIDGKFGLTACYPFDDSTRKFHLLLNHRPDFKLTVDGTEYRCQLSELKGNSLLEGMMKKAQASMNRLAFEDTSNGQLIAILEKMNRQGLAIGETPYTLRANFDPSLSGIYIDKKTGEPNGCLLAKKTFGDMGFEVSLEVLYVEKQNVEVMVALLGHFFTETFKEGNASFVVNAVTEVSEKICERVLLAGNVNAVRTPYILGLYQPILYSYWDPNDY